jgi:Tol biopolymer transport system component
VRRRGLVLLIAGALALGTLPGAASRAAARFESPYSCGYCLFEVPLGGGSMRIVWGNPQVSAVGELSPNGRRLLFSRAEPTGGEGLYVANLDGSGARRIATGAHGRWSPDGTKVAYERPMPFPCAGGALWVVSAEGTGDHRVADCALDAAWSPGSRRLAFFAVSGLNADVGTLTIADAAGAATRRLGAVQAPRDLIWSPRGDRLAFDDEPDATPASGHGVSAGGPRDLPVPEVRVVALDGKPIGVLAASSAPVWAPGGDRFAFDHVDVAVATGYEVGQFRHSLRLASPEARTLRTVRERCCGLTRWVPGGQELAYLDEGPTPKRGETATQVFVSRADGSGRRQLTHLRAGGTVDGYWFAPGASRLYVLWEFTNVD